MEIKQFPAFKSGKKWKVWRSRFYLDKKILKTQNVVQEGIFF